MQILDGIAPLANEFEFFLVDVWGVIFDGHALYPRALSALKHLKTSGKVILVSNASISPAHLANTLQTYGVDEHCFDALLTSGSVAKEWLETKGAQLGSHYFLLNADPSSPFSTLKGFTQTATIEEAAFVVIDSYPKDPLARKKAAQQLAFAHQQNLPLVCANPDIDIYRQSGQRILQAGALANDFENQGGQVVYFGKPHAPIYEVALARLGNPPKTSVCAIGDGLLTDIKGANAQDFFSTWVVQHRATITPKVLRELQLECERLRIFPNTLLTCFGP